MAGVPAFCPKCKIAFENNFIEISGVANLVLSGNSITCPKCRGRAQILDGTFAERGNGLEIITAPPITHEVLNALKTLKENVETGEISPIDAIKEAEKISPVLSSTMTNLMALGFPPLAIFLQIVALYLQYNSGVSQDEFQKEALKLMQQQNAIMEQISSKLDKEDVTDKMHTGSTQNSSPHPPKTTKKTNRRIEVNKARREALLKRRMEFNPRKKQAP